MKETRSRSDHSFVETSPFRVEFHTASVIGLHGAPFGSLQGKCVLLVI